MWLQRCWRCTTCLSGCLCVGGFPGPHRIVVHTQRCVLAVSWSSCCCCCINTKKQTNTTTKQTNTSLKKNICCGNPAPHYRCNSTPICHVFGLSWTSPTGLERHKAVDRLFQTANCTRCATADRLHQLGQMTPKRMTPRTDEFGDLGGRRAHNRPDKCTYVL